MLGDGRSLRRSTCNTHWMDGTSSTEPMPSGCRGAATELRPGPGVLGSGDGYVLVLVEAAAGYEGDPHEHTNAELSYVVSGTVEVPMEAGDGYVAAAGSTHTQFRVTSDASYVLAFKL